MSMKMSNVSKEEMIKKDILESLDLLLRLIDGDDVKHELLEKVGDVSVLDPEKGRKLKDIIGIDR